jgi:hypothetical protein
MKIRLLSALVVGLAIGFVLPTFAQQVNLDAAARAKAAAGREAHNHAPASVLAPVGTFTTFDVPGAVNGTSPSSINPAGAITGTYYDVNFVGHGFLRARNGTFATFDAPGAALIGTIPSGINPEGAITGTYYDVNFVGHGFLRTTNGTLTTFDAPGAGTTGSSPGTYAVGINPEGVILEGVRVSGNRDSDPPSSNHLTGSIINGGHIVKRARIQSWCVRMPPGRRRTTVGFSPGVSDQTVKRPHSTTENRIDKARRFASTR